MHYEDNFKVVVAQMPNNLPPKEAVVNSINANQKTMQENLREQSEEDA
jgi:hypothetical protein